MPTRIWEWTLFGATWEMVEDALASDDKTKLANCSPPIASNGNRKLWCNGVQGGNWYSKWDDIIVDILGFVVGSTLRRHTDWI